MKNVKENNFTSKIDLPPKKKNIFQNQRRGRSRTPKKHIEDYSLRPETSMQRMFNGNDSLTRQFGMGARAKELPKIYRQPDSGRLIQSKLQQSGMKSSIFVSTHDSFGLENDSQKGRRGSEQLKATNRDSQKGYDTTRYPSKDTGPDKSKTMKKGDSDSESENMSPNIKRHKTKGPHSNSSIRSPKGPLYPKCPLSP